jgi:sialate O-acetylesterase
MNFKALIFSVLFFLTFTVQAQLKIASVLGNDMVLQRNTEVNIWGKATPNKNITVKTSWNNISEKTTADEKGNWIVKVKTTQAGGTYTIQINCNKEKIQLNNILLGEVWLCSGQSNMEMPIEGFEDQPINNSGDILLDAENNQIRFFKVEHASKPSPQDTCVGKWLVANAVTVSKFSAVSYLFAKQLQQKLNVPVGVICSAWGGSRIEPWMDAQTLGKFPNALAQTTFDGIQPQHQASKLYNGMIAPIQNFTIKGALWYQGESNIINYYEYAQLMQAMVAQWRKNFNVGEFPFYFVEIAPYPYPYKGALNSALQREAQLKAKALIPNSGMVSTIDLGDEKWIHPAEKATIAKRLAMCALSETYHIEGLPYKTPTFKRMEIKDTVAIISFNDVALGLSSGGKKVNCLEIAGADKVFYPAEMSIDKKQLTVWSTNVKIPVAVRYAFSNYPKTEGYLFNTTGLPVPSFRTDNW